MLMKADKELFDKHLEAKKNGFPECPEELRKTRTLEYKGFTCLVYYNYVAPYNFGKIPANVWYGYAEGKVGDETYNWDCPLCEDIQTLEIACSAIEPLFHKSIDRIKKGHI